jgi:hypothetical protein
MLYVYKQFTMPANATGVDVQLSVVDANGNFRNIGTATTDISGTYSFQWTPDIPGKYTVLSNFAGSGAYYGSYSQAAFGVDAAPATPTPSPAPVASVADQYFIPAIAGLFVFVAIIGAIMILLMLRKRP